MLLITIFTVNVVNARFGCCSKVLWGQMDVQISLKLQQNLTQQKHADLQTTIALGHQQKCIDHLCRIILD